MAPPSLYLIVSCAVIHGISCQSVCPQQPSLEWRPEPNIVPVSWTLAGNICNNAADCWGLQLSASGESEAAALFDFPQICPLQLQHGDSLLMSADATLRSYGVRLLNVTRQEFQSCSAATARLLFPHDVTDGEPVDETQLTPGNHYFIGVHGNDTAQLCKLGLRLNVTVKAQLCQASPLLRLCSGNGACQSGAGDAAYRCHCNHQHSGTFCEKSDPCLENPCGNKGVCLSNGTAGPGQATYKCLCPPLFTGNNGIRHVVNKPENYRLTVDSKCIP